MRNRESSLQESNIHKLFIEAKSSLLEDPVKNQSKLIEKIEEIGAEKTNVKGGSIAGAESRALVKNLELPNLVFGEKYIKHQWKKSRLEAKSWK